MTRLSTTDSATGCRKVARWSHGPTQSTRTWIRQVVTRWGWNSWSVCGWKRGERKVGCLRGRRGYVFNIYIYIFLTDRTMMRGFGWRWEVAEEWDFFWETCEHWSFSEFMISTIVAIHVLKKKSKFEFELKDWGFEILQSFEKIHGPWCKLKYHTSNMGVSKNRGKTHNMDGLYIMENPIKIHDLFFFPYFWFNTHILSREGIAFYFLKVLMAWGRFSWEI